MPPLCLVFDLDDTLYLERDFVRSGFEAAGAWLYTKMRVSGFAALAWTAFESGKRGTIFDCVLSDLHIAPDPGLLSALVQIYRHHTPALSLLPDARDCIDFYRVRASLCMITDGLHTTQLAKCRSLGVIDSFDPLIVNGTPETAKPDAASFLAVASRHRSSGTTFVYVGDNPNKDFEAPLALGWRTVRVRRAGSLHEHSPSLPGKLPHFEIPDLTLLPDILVGDL
jgi:putative hydrolase of the HAD superfamily